MYHTKYIYIYINIKSFISKILNKPVIIKSPRKEKLQRRPPPINPPLTPSHLLDEIRVKVGDNLNKFNGKLNNNQVLNDIRLICNIVVNGIAVLSKCNSFTESFS